VETLLTDLRYALRMMRRDVSFTAVAVAALALGIGANTAIFTVVDAVLLQPLPYTQPDRIMRVARQFRTGIGNSVSIPKFMAWRQNQSFESLTLYDLGALAMNLGTGDPPQVVRSLRVSSEFFAVFGATPVVGRAFTAAEDLPGGPAVALMSESVWKSRFGASGDVLARPILLNGAPYTVIGILPARFHSDPDADIWIPLRADPNSTNQGNYLSVAGRLKPAVTVAAAQAEMKVIGEQFRKTNPKWMDEEESVSVVSMRDALGGEVRTALLILAGAVALVLLIACANVANLLLARAAGRQRELAIRSAMGADRWRVGRQLLTESVLLAIVGGALGLALGAWGVRVLLLFVPGNIPRLTDASGAHAAIPVLDARVTLFTVGVSVLTGLLFGLFPALRTSKPDLSSTLKEAGGRSGTGLHQRARGLLVITEVALALVLLVGAALLIRSFVGLRSVNPGFDPKNVLTFQTSLTGRGYGTSASVDALSTQAIRRIEAIPGVQFAASTIALPVENGIDLPFAIVGRAPSSGDYNGDEQWRSVSPHYFDAFRIPLVRGRLFSENDTGGNARVVIINQAMAQKYWAKDDPVGQAIVIGKGLGPQFDDPPRQIVGIVGNVRENGLQNAGVGVMYLPQSQVPEGITQLANSVIPLSWAVRTAADPLSMRVAVERELHTVDAQMPISRERAMEQVIAEAIARQNFNMVLLTIFAGVALILAAIGVYGLMSYSVGERTREIGIRMALGADRGTTLRMVLFQGVKLAGIGVVAGLALAFGLTRLLASLLFGVNASDPVTFVAVAAVLATVAAIAAYIPARRATAVDPVVALRQE
jgi:predicted permease